MGLLVVVALVLLTPGAGVGEATAQEAQKPNIIFVMTDDQMPSTLSHMQAVTRELVAEGITFESSVNTLPVCCPSHAVIQRGQYPHNTLVLSNRAPHGGYFRFHGLQGSTTATWLDDAGYETGYFGRFMNGYQGSRVPG